MAEERRGRPKGSISKKSPDMRVRRRNEAARMVQKPDGLDLIRRPDDRDAAEPIKAAIMAALITGTPAHQIAQQYNLPVTRVKQWEQAYDISNPLKRRDRISESMVLYVEQEIRSLIAISIATSDEDWIKLQPASELATFIGVKTDRLFKVLEVFGKASASMEQIKREYGDTIDGEYGE